jgi:hypothetical protein
LYLALTNTYASASCFCQQTYCYVLWSLQASL